MRPDEGRCLMCLYWSVLDLPDWFRVKDAGWFTLLVVATKRLARIPGKTSGLFRRVFAHILRSKWELELSNNRRAVHLLNWLLPSANQSWMRSFGRESNKGSLEFEGKLRDQTLRQLQTRRWPDGCGKGWLPCSLLLGLTGRLRSSRRRIFQSNDPNLETHRGDTATSRIPQYGASFWN